MLRAVRSISSQVAALVLVAFTAMACSETVQGGIIMPSDAGNDVHFKAQDIGGTKPKDAQPTDNGAQDAESEPDVVTKRVIIPMLNIMQPQVIPPTGSAAQLPIYAKVIDYTLGSPADGVAVMYAITDNNGPNGPGAGFLDSQMTATDGDGLCGNVFHANKSPAVDYKVCLSCEGAETVCVDISVTDNPKGGLKVKMLYDNQISIGEVSVRVVAPPFSCATFKPVIPNAAMLSKTATLSDTVEFNPLAAEKKYGVYVLGKDTDGHLGAAGCADAVYIQDKFTTEITVNVYTLPLQAAGPYDMVNHFDFTGAIPGQLGQILDTAVQIFYDPGAFIIDQIKNLIKNWLPGILVDAAFSLFEKQLSKVVTDWLLNSSPPWLQSFFGMGQDVLQIVKKLEMLAILKIYKVSNDFNINGEIDFTGVNLYWKLGCDKTDPNYADCGKISLDMSKAVTDPNFPLDFLSGKITGTISQQKKLTIDSGTIKLNYGKLIMYVLMEVVLKKITGQTSFSGAISALINCKGIGQAVGSIGIIKASDVENACNTTVNLLVLPLESMINGLALDSKLSLTGGCNMVDLDDDLKVDKLVDGYWVGNIVADTPGKPFSGDFVATRQPGF